MTQSDYDILTNIIGAVETGGQIYGKRRYETYTKPYTNSKLEHTITLGWAGFYGYEAKRLVQMIYDADPDGFKKIDSDGKIQGMLSRDWVATRWNPTAVQKNVLIMLIDSEVGHKMQDALFQEEMKTYVKSCEETYTSDVPAVMMYCECRHLGGKSGADRIFKRCNGNYSLDSIMASLKKDQADTSSSNQVGDKVFWSRHVKCREFIEKYVGKGEQMATPLERAKIFLRQTSLKSMTGYTPTGASGYKNANAWTTVPKKGYVVYFWGKPSGESNKRICHVGIVESVSASAKTFGTIEGNTSSSTFTTNGGCVARHTYSYASVGGSNRVNGFGIPDFDGAGITADAFVAMAQSYIGYEEKKSNAYLDDFHANAGRNNYQKFQRDVVGYTGDQWCQYFVDAMAFYSAGGGSKGSGGSGGSSTRSYLQKGDTGSAVKTMQSMLIALGYNLGKYGADGDFGNATLDAVKKFQSDNGLTVDGYYGVKSNAKLEELYKAKQSAEEANSTVFEGVDYAPVYNYSYYRQKYEDLQKAFGTDKAKYFQHFCKYGMREGRRAASAFDVHAYKNRYEDLQKAYGDYLPNYYRHYCKYGKKEDRKAT